LRHFDIGDNLKLDNLTVSIMAQNQYLVTYNAKFFELEINSSSIFTRSSENINNFPIYKSFSKFCGKFPNIDGKQLISFVGIVIEKSEMKLNGQKFVKMIILDYRTKQHIITLNNWNTNLTTITSNIYQFNFCLVKKNVNGYLFSTGNKLILKFAFIQFINLLHFINRSL